MPPSYPLLTSSSPPLPTAAVFPTFQSAHSSSQLHLHHGWNSLKSAQFLVPTSTTTEWKTTRSRSRVMITCMASPRRVKMVAKQIRRELSDMLLTDKVLQYAVLPEASLGADRYLSSLTTISDVEVSGDLQVVKVYVSVFGDERGRELAISGLKSKSKYVRSELGKRMKLRLTPEIRFIEDESLERGSRVIAILDRLKDEKKNLQDEDLESTGANEENIDCDEDDLDDEEMELGVTKFACSGLVEDMKILSELQPKSNGRKAINSELWHACAGPLVTLPQPGSLVYYFPQGHSEQLTASTRRTANAHIPTYPCLPSQMMCQLHNVTLQADKESDEIYAQMTLQPVNSENDVFQIPDFGLTKSKQPKEFFCKTLTASDTSTHGGFSVPRRAAEKLFPILDYSVQPPNQELVVQDLHDNTWTFRHIYRGQPKRHLLTTGWSVFVSAKRLKAGDSVLFIRGEKSQLMLGIRRANRHQTMLPSSVLSADSMHMGVLAAAAHAAANRTKFIVYYNPRACPSEFVVPLAKYHRAVFGTQVSTGMRFGMMFETEDSNKRRYMGTVSGVSDLDQLRWPNSKWRNIQVEWDENGCAERPVRVNLWEIECPDNSFPFFSSASASSLKRSYPGFFGWENMIRNPLPSNRENRFNSNQNHNVLHDPEVLIKTLFNQNHLLPNYSHSSPVCHHPQLSSYYSALQNILVKNNEGFAGEMENLGQEYITSEGALSAQQFESSAVELPDQLPNFSQMNFPVQQQQQLEEAEHASVYSNSNYNLPPIFETNVSQGAVEPDTNNPILFEDTNNGNVGFPSQSDSCDQPPQPQSQPPLGGEYMDGLGWMLMNPSNWESNFQEDEMFGQELLNDEFPPFLGEVATDHPQSCGLKDLTDVQVSAIYSIDYDDNSNNGSALLDPSQSTTSPEGGLGGTMWNSGLYNASLITPCCSSGNTSPMEESNPSNKDGSCSWKKNNKNKKKGSSLRTFTKVQKQGSVGRSIDVTRFKDYIQLKRAIANMFGLSCSDDPGGLDWKLVYMDFENDVLLVGDDPWEEFIRCVRCIRILSPEEVRQLPTSDHQV